MPASANTVRIKIRIRLTTKTLTTKNVPLLHPSVQLEAAAKAPIKSHSYLNKRQSNRLPLL
jgi:hypothetical protein